MEGAAPVVDRRTALRALGVLGLVAALPACTSPFAGTRLTVAAGEQRGVYFTLGTALARAWDEELGLGAPPAVRTTAGSVDNLTLLASGGADVVFSQVDTAADAVARVAPADPRAPRALARIYDDAVHVVVPAGSPVTALRQLRGARVSIGAPESGVSVIARRLLRVAGIDPDRDLRAEQLGLAAATDALSAGGIDALFWSGGLPTVGVAELAERFPIRLLDLEDVVAVVRAVHPVYAAGTVPAATYGIPEPITTLLVRNVLLVPAAMDADLATALVRGLFDAQEELAVASPAALRIDLRAAIGTQPVPLHPGAERFFRETKEA